VIVVTFSRQVWMWRSATANLAISLVIVSHHEWVRMNLGVSFLLLRGLTVTPSPNPLPLMRPMWFPMWFMESPYVIDCLCQYLESIKTLLPLPCLTLQFSLSSEGFLKVKLMFYCLVCSFSFVHTHRTVFCGKESDM
jgi:hypothetical protein